METVRNGSTLCFLGWSNHDQRLVISGSGDVNIALQYSFEMDIGEDLQSGRIGVSQGLAPLCLDSLAKVADVIWARLDFANITDVVSVMIHNLDPH
jgi:hypothetical protein